MTVTLRNNLKWYFVRNSEGFGLAVFDEGFYSPLTNQDAANVEVQ